VNSKKIIKTQEAWEHKSRPCILVTMAYNHEYKCGMGLLDSLVSFSNLGEEIKRWLGSNEVTGTKNLTNTPSSGYTQMVYGDGTKLIAYSAVEVGHTVPLHEDLVLK
jgi:acetylxylan esterase